MKCPVCGSVVADTLTVCPACRTNLAQTRVMPRMTGTWCASCGALVPTGAHECPKCGMPQEAPAPAPQRRVRTHAPSEAPTAEELALEKERTHALPRIESAIPSEPDPVREQAYGRERLPHSKVFLVAALASLLVVGGGVLAITHPWDPSLSDTRATMPADTSQAGFPGTVSKLQGQDTKDLSVSVASADEITFSALTDAYNELGSLSAKADELERTFDDKAITGSADERANGSSASEELSIEVSNLVSTIAKIDVSSTGTYTDQRDHVATLASWLRNRTDALTSAWKLSADSDAPSADAAKIKAPMQGQRASDSESSYAALFAKNYEAWAPQQR